MITIRNQAAPNKNANQALQFVVVEVEVTAVFGFGEDFAGFG